MYFISVIVFSLAFIEDPLFVYDLEFEASYFFKIWLIADGSFQ